MEGAVRVGDFRKHDPNGQAPKLFLTDCAGEPQCVSQSSIHHSLKAVVLKNDANNASPLPDHAIYGDAVEAMKRYHEAQASSSSVEEIERLRQIAESQFQAVN